MAGIAVDRELTSGREVVLATVDDDAGLRTLLRRSVIPGEVRVAFTREPTYLAGTGLAGSRDVTVVARRDGALVGMGHVSAQPLMRNGQLQRIGYFSELRVAPGTPAAPRLLRDGYTLLAEESERVGVDGFFTSIASDNVRARSVLEHGGRLGIPVYRALCDLVTLVAPVPLERRAVKVRAEGETNNVEAAKHQVDVSELTEFLKRGALASHLSLAWDPTRWMALASHGVTPGDFCAVRRDGRIVAAAGVWDQRAFRQVVIDGYGRSLRLTRPLLNLVQRARRLPVLPAPGEVLAQGSLLAAHVPDVRDWPALWKLVQQHSAQRGLSWLTLARDARDQQLPLLRRVLGGRSYHTTLYDVMWRDRPTWRDAWSPLPFRPEVGLL